MSYAKHGLRAFGLCLLAALCLMALGAAGAQAEVGWLVNGAFITTKTAIHAVKHAEKDPILLVPALGAAILCSTLSSDDGLLFTQAEKPGKTEGLITLLFTTCNSKQNGSPVPACNPAEPITAQVRFHLFLHEPNGVKLTYILFEPDTVGQPFTTLKFSEECAWGEEAPIGGSFVAECLSEELKKMSEISGTPDLCLTDMVHHLIQEAPSQKSLFGDGLTFGSLPMQLDGIISLSLSAPNEGKTWGGHI
jgi:hypothetical protein